MTAGKEPRGQETNTCERCHGSLRADDGHFHSASDVRGYPIEICCRCACPLRATNSPIPPLSAVLANDLTQKSEEDVQFEKRVYEIAQQLGTFSVTKLWEEVDSQREDAAWYWVRRILEENPDKYERLGRKSWRVLDK